MEKEETNQYFGEKEERAVINYIKSNSKEEKNRIYNEILIEPFRKMIQSILRRYPIHIGNYEMEEIESNALSHMIDQMVKYKPYIIEFYHDEKWIKLGDGYRFLYKKNADEKLLSLKNNNENIKYRIFCSKAYSYCQTIVRNYYKDHSKKTYNDKMVNLCYDEYIEEINKENDYIYEMDIDYLNKLEILINNIIKKIQNKLEKDKNLKKNEIIVGDAIINILSNWQELFMEETPEGNYNKKITNKFTKNKILLFLKEQTGLNTKEIRMGIKPFKDIYFFEKKEIYDD